MWYLTPDMWHLTCDTWWWVKILYFSSPSRYIKSPVGDKIPNWELRISKSDKEELANKSQARSLIKEDITNWSFYIQLTILLIILYISSTGLYNTICIAYKASYVHI